MPSLHPLVSLYLAIFISLRPDTLDVLQYYSVHFVCCDRDHLLSLCQLFWGSVSCLRSSVFFSTSGTSLGVFLIGLG